MTGVAKVWLTDNELELLVGWYWHAFGGFDEGVGGEDLKNKLQALRGTIACTVPGARTTRASDV